MIPALFRSYPRWFKVSLISICCIYLTLWSLGIYLKDAHPEIILPVMGQDSTEYAALSDSLLYDHAFTDQSGQPETFRTPGYPTFIMLIRALFGPSFFTVTLIQIFITLGTILLIERVGQKLYPGNAPRFAALVYGINPVTLSLTLTVFSDILFIGIYFFFVWICSRTHMTWHKAVVSAGIIGGIALYVRPMGIFAIPMFVIPYFLFRTITTKNALRAIALCGILLACTIPWSVRNYYATGVLSFTSLASYNLAYYNVPMFLSSTNGSNLETERKRIEDYTDRPFVQWRHLPGARLADLYTHEVLLSNFGSYFLYHVTTSIPFFFASDIELGQYMYATAFNLSLTTTESAVQNLTQGDVATFLTKALTPWWRSAERLVWLAAWILSLYTIWKFRYRLWPWALFAIIVYTALLAGPVSNARYRLPVEPFVYILAGSALSIMRHRTSHEVRSEPDSK